MLRGVLTILTFLVVTTVLGIAAIVAGLVTGRRTMVFRLGRLWAKAHLKVMGIEPEYIGLEHAAGTAPRVFLANHASNLDIWALTPVLPITTRFVSKRTIFWIPVLGQAMALAGFIAIDRKDRASAIRSLGRAADKVRRGASVILFPEGTRSRNGRLGRFKRGAFHLAVEASVAVVPVAISGAYDVLKPKSIVVRPGPVRVTFAPPIDVASYAGNLDGLIERVRSEIAAGLAPDERPETDL